MRAFITALGLAASTIVLAGVELKPATLVAYDRYIALTEARLASERDGTRPFLWVDQQPAATRAQHLARLTSGQVVLAKLETRDRGTAIPVADGLIHHWIGTVFMPGVSIDRLVAFVQDYERYPQIFSPLIPRTRVLARDGDRFVVSMRTFVKKVITVTMDADPRSDVMTITPARFSGLCCKKS